MSRIRLALICALLLFSAVGCSYGLSRNSNVIVGDKFSELVTDVNFIPNSFQYHTRVWLGTYEHQLIIYRHDTYSSKKTPYDGWLCVLKAGKIEKLHEIGNGTNVRIVGSYDQFVYYWVYGKNGNDSLFCYDLDARTETLLFSGAASRSFNVHIDESGAFFIPLDLNERGVSQSFVHVQDGHLISVSDMQMCYRTGDLSYCNSVRYPRNLEHVVVIDKQNGEYEIPLGIAQSRIVIPSKYGAVVHNEGYSELLYLVRDSGEVKCLFDVPCMSSDSAITVVGEFAFISLKRYEGYNDIFLKRYENDDIEGTYIISLDDYSVMKISECIYTGLFYFGGEYLYAIDEYGCIYLIDFNGVIHERVFYVE